MRNTNRLVFFSFMVTLGTILHVLEAMLPNPLPIPGVKLGLANIVTLLTIYRYGWREGLLVAVMRVLLGSLLLGTFLSVGFMMGLAGAIFSTFIMALLAKYVQALSIVGVSMAGAVSHNLGQLLVASYLIETKYILFYLPILMIVALPTGFLTGYISRMLSPYIRQS